MSALGVAGCGDPNWSEWMPVDAGASAVVTPRDVVDVADALDAGDALDASEAGDAYDASDAGDASEVADAEDASIDVSLAIDASTSADTGAMSVDVPAPPVDRAPAVDVGVDAPIDRGAPVEVGVDAGIDVPVDRGAPADVGFDVPIDRGVDAGIDVPVDRGAPADVGFDAGRDAGFDVPVDRGVDTGFDVPIDRGVDTGVDVPVDLGVDVGFDVPIDRGVDTGVDVPIDRGVDTGVDVPVDRGPADTGPADTGPAGADPVAYTGSFAARTGRFNTALTVQGERRAITLVVPTSAGASPPMILLFHGTNGDGPGVVTESNAQALANSAGVIIAAPSSRWMPTGDFDHATEETYWETAPNDDLDANQDLVLVRAIMVEAQRAYGVDPQRIYAMGHSNGAFFAEFVAVLLRDRIAAFSENSGGVVRCGRTTSCRFQGAGATCAALRAQASYCACAGPELPTPVPATGRMPPGFLTHGTRDPLVSVYYTCTLADLMSARGHTQVTSLFNGEGHAIPPNWAQLVWPFFVDRRLGDR